MDEVVTFDNGSGQSSSGSSRQMVVEAEDAAKEWAHDSIKPPDIPCESLVKDRLADHGASCAR